MKKQAEKKATDISQLSYEEYCSVLKLAEKIRTEKAKEINLALDAKDKIRLLDQLFTEYHIPGHSASSPKEKEQAIILKVNIFIPDNEQFLNDYKNQYDKNIRLISEGYKIPAPFAISKIAELSRYEKYQKKLKEEGGLTTTLVAPLELPEHEVTPKEPTSAPDQFQSSTSDAIVTELQRHIHSMEGYYQKILTSNEQLGKENEELAATNFSLERKIQELKSFIETLQAENFSLGEQILSLKEQGDNSHLKKQIEDLEATNAKLLTALQLQSKSSSTYRSRAIVAEAQLEQLRDQMLGIAKQVDSIETTAIYGTEEGAKEPKI